MSESIQSTASQSSLTPSTTPTSLLELHPHTTSARLLHSNSSKHGRGRSLGLIDAARVRLSKDFPSILRSSSKSGRLHPTLPAQQAGEPDDRRFFYPDYDHNLPSPSLDLEVELMDIPIEERHGRSLGSRIVQFLSRSRSRSRSKKRRSRSMDDISVCDVPMPIQSGSLGRHTRHASSSDDQDASGSSTSTSKPFTRSQSRPLSSTTTATNSTVRPRPKRPPEPATVSPPDHHVHIQTEILPLQATSSNSARKGKKTNIFSMAIPAPRKYSVDSSRSKSRPNTPSPGPGSRTTPVPNEKRNWVGRFRSGSGSSTKANDNLRRSPLLPDHDAALRGGAGGNRANMLTPQPRGPAPVHILNSPPFPRGEYAQYGDHHDTEPEVINIDGRCSPLCGWPAGTSSSSKGKEKERTRGAKERQEELARDRDRSREKERITGPRRVGSPQLRERERESRSVIGTAPMEKVPSGSGGSRRSSAKDSASHSNNTAASAMKIRRIKHGSFDFERPVSTTRDGPPVSTNTALKNMGIGPHTQPKSAVPMQRSSSLKAAPGTSGAPNWYTRTQTKQQQPGSAPDSYGRSRRPQLDVNTNPPLLRQGTDSSAGTSRASGSRHYQPHSDADPSSPISSHSANSSSWGRAAGKHAVRGSHGPFKFEPAVPPIPGSPASDERRPSAARGNAAPVPPSKLRQDHVTSSKGRSLDLGLGLSWAPSKVKEEAVLAYADGGVTRRPTVTSSTGSLGRAKARWRGAWVDEEGRLGSHSTGASSDVAEAFKEALGEAAYATFKTYVHRFDAHAIPLDGPSGLISHAKRLLDYSNSLDERRKQALLVRFVRFVQENQ